MSYYKTKVSKIIGLLLLIATITMISIGCDPIEEQNEEKKYD